jgi:hypothetical protein
VMRRWFGASGRRVPPIIVEGEHDLPLDEALVVDDVGDLPALKVAFDEGRPVVVRAASADAVVAALARPEVSCVLVPPEKRDLVDLDLVELTYGA